jgi:hypothetical protein
MRVIVQNHYDFITTNGYLFTNPESDIGAGLLRPWNDLYVAAKERGIELFTPDQHDEGDLLILVDRPTVIKAKAPRTIAVLYEPEVVLPNNYDKEFLDSCEKVFTWDDRLVDDKKFIKSNFTTIEVLTIKFLCLLCLGSSSKLNVTEASCSTIISDSDSNIDDFSTLLEKRTHRILGSFKADVTTKESLALSLGG